MIIFELDISRHDIKIMPSIELFFKIGSKEDIDGMGEEHYGYDEKAVKLYQGLGYKVTDVYYKKNI